MTHRNILLIDLDIGVGVATTIGIQNQCVTNHGAFGVMGAFFDAGQTTVAAAATIFSKSISK